MGSSLLRPFPTFEVSLPSLSSQLLFSISFPPSILTRIPLFFSPFYSPFLVTILSHFLKTTSLQVGGLMDPHLHPYSHVMSPTNCRIFLYLTVFTVTGLQVQVTTFQVPRYPFYTQRFVTYIMTIRLITGTELLSFSFLLYLTLTDHSQHLANFLSFATMGSWVPRLASSPKSQFLITLVHPRHLHAFPNTYLVSFNANNSSCIFRKGRH